MGFELLKLFQVETRRFLWLIGLVCATILLFQCIEHPKGKGITLGSLFSSQGEVPNQNVTSLFSEATTSDPVMSSPSILIEDQKSSSGPSLVTGNNTESNVFSITEASSSSSSVVSSLHNLAPNRSIESITTLSPNVSMKFSTAKSENKEFLPPLSPVVYVSPKKLKQVYTLTDMNELLSENYLSPTTVIPRWSSKAEEDLFRVRQLIQNAPPLKDGLYAPLYRNASMFQRSYELMEQMFKIYIYKEGDKQIFHRPALEGIYASEGWFMKQMEADRHFVTKQPTKAHLFYLPFSSFLLVKTLYVPNSHNRTGLIQRLKDYVNMISSKYSFWNRTGGADHFFVACHDWAPSETYQIMANCIRVLCNADVKANFTFGKDVSLPETYVRKARTPLRDIGGKPLAKRKTLAFFAGQMHGYLRPVLLDYWGNKSDPDMKIFGKLPPSKDNRMYLNYMKSSKYCICPRGFEVNSPRVVEAIFYECVPVIISDNFVPPMFETLNWESFAVFVAEKDIPNLKNILLSIPKKTYLQMRMRVRKVQHHFLWHPQPVKYDLYHMILHSIWFTRVFQFRP